ncbi:hypothetical protein PGTDC60_0335 [Porphyromonas gingivalis TDC60]|nr:hypothetical protein CS543_01715 [Porphyromonas gingivalis]ERJ67544.1 hypothetical protein HMPREF1554_00931 [Porphyromonas gingivalis F0569]BAK24504.1 hypothetical protein PGTDC60_0335 [Porphyromonas gingivalis TDC60]
MNSKKSKRLARPDFNLYLFITLHRAFLLGKTPAATFMLRKCNNNAVNHLCTTDAGLRVQREVDYLPRRTDAYCEMRILRATAIRSERSFLDWIL